MAIKQTQNRNGENKMTSGQETLMENIRTLAKRNSYKPVDYSEIMFNALRIGVSDVETSDVIDFLTSNFRTITVDFEN